MSNAFTSCFRLTLIVTILLGISVGAQAADVTYFTLPGARDNANENVNAIATFATGGNMIMITLTNQQANPRSVGQSLSDLIFTTSSSFTSAGIATSSGTEVSVASDGVPTHGASVPVDWGISSAGNTITLDLLGTAEAPIHTIIGPPDPTGNYSDANASIAGSGPHNPFIDGTAMWTINAPGVSSATTITAVTFSFGTTAGDDNPGITSHMGATPEISSLLLMGTGVLGLTGVLRRKLKLSGGCRRVSGMSSGISKSRLSSLAV